MTAHAEFLRAASNDEPLAAQVKADFRGAPLSARDRAMLEFVETLSLSPWAATLDGLRGAGFDEVEILQVVLGCAHFNYLNRMADGLGVHLEYESALPPFQLRSRDPAPSPAPAPRGSFAALPAPGRRDPVPARTQEAERLNFRSALAANPEACSLATEWRAFQLRATPGLGERTRARIALFCAGLDHCEYARLAYEGLLARREEPSLIREALARAEVPSLLPPAETLFLEHAARLTREPWTTRAAHLDDLRGAGLDDRGILQFTMLVGYLSFENRVALGLGLRPEAQ